MSTIVDLLRDRAGARATTLAYHFIADGDDATTISYGDLDRVARRIAVALADRAAAGRPVLLLYPPGLDYVAGFLGCLYAGAVAVPAYPPDPARWDRTLPRLRALVADCGARTALTIASLAELAPGLAAAAPELAGLDWLATDRLPPGTEADWSPPPVQPGAPALLQYTSGSTGTPRGVLLSHANLLHNAELVHGGFGTTPATIGVSWLPPYHDMGLIGGILQPLYTGFPVLLMSPLDFLRRPLSWLEAIARSGATMSGGPNFAFDLCVRKSTPEQRAALDLSRWAVAFCGAEPVRANTLDRFAAAFAPAGFRREAFYPCYGLAEATLIVTGGQPPRITASGQVGCGRPLGDQRLVVVDPATGAGCPPGTEGELWLAGPSVAQGYWRRPAETAQTFGARLAGDPDRRYLRTGDLGFLTPDRELVVTGRIKDLIVVRGRNLYPPDLERAVEAAVPAVRPGGCAAFPLVRAGGAERVGIACELATEPAGGAGPATGEVVAAIRQAVAEAAEVAAATVVLLRKGRVPKTSSGKIQRYACRQAASSGEWAAGTPDVLARWDDPALEEPAGSEPPPTAPPPTAPPPTAPPPTAPPPTAPPPTEPAPTEPAGGGGLVGLVAGALGLPPEAVPADQPLTRLGLDSLRAIELQGTLRDRLGLPVTVAELLGGVTAGELAGRRPDHPEPASPAAAATGTSRPEPAEPEAAGAADPGAARERPASAGQRALWLIEQWSPDRTAYQVARAARIRSRIDPDRLERALRAAVDRHPALRTCLPTRDGEPVQRWFEWTGPVLTRHRVDGLTEAELRRRVQTDADQGFDLTRGPLFRAALYTRGETDHVLLLALHHTITDFWSLSILVDELLAGYPGTAPPGDPPGDLDRDLHQDLDQDLDHLDQHHLRYWRRVLAGAPPALELPTTFPRPRLQSYRGASHQFRLTPDRLRRLDRFAAEAGLTRFAVVAAGFAAVLARYAGEPDVVLGAPTAGRDRNQHHQLGYFVNPVPLRVRVDPAGTFRALAGQVRDAVAGALDHPVPFPRLVEELRPVRDPGRTPVLQAMIGVQQPPAGRPDLGAFAVADQTARLRRSGLDLQPYRLAERGSAFDLGLTLAEVDDGLTGELTYCTDLFDEPAVARLAGHLTTLLGRAGRAPDAPLATLELLDERERAAMLALATGPATRFPDQTTLAALFTERARRQPDATAVVAGGQRLSYTELDQRADQLAIRLASSYGVRRGDLVGVHLPRGLDAIVGFWAALKSGGGYLPLPADLPPGRLAWLLGDARPVVLLTHRALAGRLPPGGPPPVCLDEPAPPLPAGARPPDRTGPDDLAYLLYTSGSTGRPKAVLLAHRGACNLAQTEIDGMAITPGSRLLQGASLAYDVHVSEVLTAHLSGAQLHIPEPAAAVPGPALVELLARERITHVWQSPSVLATLPDTDLPGLRHILCGGEACPPEVVARWAVPGRQFLNGYGPAEITVCATWGECRPADRRRPPIGRPMPNLRVYVLDRELVPVPVGVPGEICIGGVGVGWGYLGRPGLTAERFLPDPFYPRPGARLYRTGDRARWLPDGSLDFLGRLDDQVKIRGVRIEPGEVAARVRELLGVREVAVVPRPGPAGLELVAYLVADGARRPVAELRGRLRAELSEPWLPAAFVYLAALPLNRSGKLDRRALPEPAPADRGLTAPLAPRTELERLVAQVWAGVLGQVTVGVRDHFFDQLGGSSLLVARVTSELGRRLGRELPVTLLFEHPTVESLARRLAGLGAAEPAITPEDQAARRRRALARRSEPPGGGGA
jgi:amino acid adenylation domain-containing protein